MDAKILAVGGAAIAALAVIVGLDMRDDHKFAEGAKARFATIDKIEKTVKGQLAAIQTIDERVGNRLKTLEGLEQAVVGSADTVEALDKSVAGRLQALDETEKTVAGRLEAIEGLEQSVAGRLEAVSGLEKTVTGRLQALQGEIGKFDARIAELRGQLDGLNARMDEVVDRASKVAGLGVRIAGFEEILGDLRLRMAELDGKAGQPNAVVASAEADKPAPIKIMAAAVAQPAAAPKAAKAEPYDVGLSVGQSVMVKDRNLFLSRVTDTDAYFVIDRTERASAGLYEGPASLGGGCSVHLKGVGEGQANLTVDCS